MLLVIEVGNTNTKIGVFSGPRLLVSWRLTTRREQTADEYGVFIQTLLSTRGIEPQRITGVAISNVVPTVQQTLEAMSDTYFGVQPFSVEPGRSDTVPLAVEAPQEVGADRICDMVGGVTLYGSPLIVVNFGTATTLTGPPISARMRSMRPSTNPAQPYITPDWMLVTVFRPIASFG